MQEGRKENPILNSAYGKRPERDKTNVNKNFETTAMQLAPPSIALQVAADPYLARYQVTSFHNSWNHDP